MDATAPPSRPDAGLCDSCVFVLVRPTRKGTVYVRCGKAGEDPSLPKYPRLPVVQCRGHLPR